MEMGVQLLDGTIRYGTIDIRHIGDYSEQNILVGYGRSSDVSALGFEIISMAIANVLSFCGLWYFRTSATDIIKSRAWTSPRW